MTLIALVFLGFRAALEVTLLRILLGSVLGGTFLSPTFFLSLAGGLASVGIMGLLYREGRQVFSLVGISVVAAYAHTTARMWKKRFSLLRNLPILRILIFTPTYTWTIIPISPIKI